MDPLLKVKNLSKSFGGLSALSDISLKVAPKQIVGIIGPNGAGKTTFFNCLSCLYHPSGGEIEFGSIPLATPVSKAVKDRVRILAWIFFILGVIRLPLFWSFFLPETFFKVELFLLGIFVLAIRFLLLRGLMRQEIWAWGLMFVFLLSDLCFALLFLMRGTPSDTLVLTRVPLPYGAVPWGSGQAFSASTSWVCCALKKCAGFTDSEPARMRFAEWGWPEHFKTYASFST